MFNWYNIFVHVPRSIVEDFDLPTLNKASITVEVIHGAISGVPWDILASGRKLL